MAFQSEINKAERNQFQGRFPKNPYKDFLKRKLRKNERKDTNGHCNITLITTFHSKTIIGFQLNRFVGHYQFYLWWHLLDVVQYLGTRF